jgi:acetylornithine/N-succinyldiaminopimelate aminotransferase
MSVQSQPYFVDEKSKNLFPTFKRKPIAFERGDGSWLTSTTGLQFLDFAAGIAVNSLGHSHPHIVEALTAQAGKLWHISNLYEIPAQQELARRLCEASFADQVFFCNSGAEAVEASIKTARRYHYDNGAPERSVILTFEGAFHGRTLATLSAGGQAKYLEGFGEPVSGFRQIGFRDMDALEAAIRSPDMAAVLMEPIQGEGGVRAFNNPFLRQVRELCDETGTLLIYDEVQSGIGRTGTLFAHEPSGATPDLLAVAKGLGAGFPVGACLARGNISQVMQPGTHASTFGGNPLAMAVGNAVLDVILEDGFLEKVRMNGLRFKQKLAELVDSHSDVFAGVQGEGLMLGLKCVAPATDVVQAAFEQQLLMVPAGDNVARLLPPLTASVEEFDQAIDKLKAAVGTLNAAEQTA